MSKDTYTYYFLSLGFLVRMFPIRGISSVPPNPATSDRKRLPPLLRRAWYALNQAFRQRVAHLGLTPDQFSILRWLVEGDPAGLTQRQITDLMASDPNTITSTFPGWKRPGSSRANRMNATDAPGA